MFPALVMGLLVVLLAVAAVLLAVSFGVVVEAEEHVMFPLSSRVAARSRRRSSQPAKQSAPGAGKNVSYQPHGRNTETARSEKPTPCKHGRAVIPVTAEEVLALTDFLRMSRTKGEVELLCQSAESNDRQCTPGHLGCDRPPCPLLKMDGSCSVRPVRPQYCRLAERFGGLPDKSAHKIAQVADDLEPGRPREKSEAACYELNSALAVALSEPEGRQFIQTGAQLFAHCRRVS